MSDDPRPGIEEDRSIQPVRPSAFRAAARRQPPLSEDRLMTYRLAEGEDRLVPVFPIGKLRLRVLDRAGQPWRGAQVQIAVIRKKNGEDKTISRRTVTAGPTGYATTRLTEEANEDTRIEVTPVVEGRLQKDSARTFGASAEQRSGAEMIRVEQDAAPLLTEGHLDMPGLSTVPDPGDLEIAPELFHPTVIEKNGTCALDFTASVETRQFFFNQIVRVGTYEPPIRTTIASRDPISQPISFDWIPGEQGVSQPQKPALGKLNLYKQSWTRVGHGVGQLLYSLALAPCEETKIATIEWSREERGRRRERTESRERLQHELHRDRMIEEVVHGSVDEVQRGHSSTKQAGAGITGGLGNRGSEGVLGSIGMSLGGSVASSHSFSEGHREITSNTLNSLADNVVQRTTSLRSLRSMVVTQSQEVERENIRTRIVRNHNRNHAMTVEYFQVLEHYKVQTEVSEQRDVLLIPYEVPALLWDDVPDFKRFREGDLQSALIPWLDRYSDNLRDLLPPDQHAGLEALYRLIHTPEIYDQEDQKITVSDWNVEIQEGWREGLSLIVHLTDSQEVLLKRSSEAQGAAVSSFTSHPVDISKINQLEVLYAPEKATTSVINKVANEFGVGEHVEKFEELSDKLLGGAFGKAAKEEARKQIEKVKKYHLRTLKILGRTDQSRFLSNTRSYTFLARTKIGEELSVDNPSWVDNTEVVPSLALDLTETRRYEDYRDLERLILHLKAHRMPYLRALWLGEDPDRRALRLENYAHPYRDEDDNERNVPVLELIENRPVGVMGNLVAFPLQVQGQRLLHIGEGLEEAERVEGLTLDEMLPDPRLVSLPTRGVYAETLLSKCNATEIRDVDRMIDPKQRCDVSAPDITGISPGSRRSGSDLQPSQLPSPVVNVQNPPSAPTPTRAGDVLGTLASGQIFRDMSLGSETVGAAQALAQRALQESGSAQRATLEQLGETLEKAEQEAESEAEKQAVRAAKERAQTARQAARQEANEQYRRSDPVRNRDHAQVASEYLEGEALKRHNQRTFNAEDYPQPQVEKAEASSPAQRDRQKTYESWRKGIVETARDEEEFWTRPDGTKFAENDRGANDHLLMVGRLTDYFAAIPMEHLKFSGSKSFEDPQDAYRWNALHAALGGRDSSEYNPQTDSALLGGEQLRTENGNIANNAWSAAFVSYVVANAGVQQDSGFYFSPRHLAYIAQALANRKNNDLKKPFWLYEIGEQSILPGDILCKNRSSGRHWSYQEVENRRLKKDRLSGLWRRVSNTRGSSHTDVVVDRFEKGGDTYVETLGGNTLDLGPNGNYEDNGSTVSSTVGRKIWRLPGQSGGKIVMVDRSLSKSSHFDENADEVFAVISIKRRSA